MIRTSFDGLTAEGLPVRSYRDAVKCYRRVLVARAIAQNGGNRSAAARELGISRQALLHLIGSGKERVTA
jgi:DNA-binding NtrC family response regulator